MDSRGYERENRGRRLPRRMRERENAKRRKEIYLLIACILLVVNVLLLLKLQSQMSGMNKALGQLLNRMSISWHEEEIPFPDEIQTKAEVPNEGYYSTGEPEQRDEIVDYVSLCGLPEVEKPVKRTKKQVLARLEELARDSDVIAEIYQDHSLYADNMLKALANNPEMADFVKNSLNASDKPTNVGLSVLEKGQDYPLFLQWDPRWGYESYGENNIGLSGCGPTCVSMALYYLLGDESLTPDKIAKYSMDNGYYVIGAGTAWALLENAPAEYGVEVSQPRASEQNMQNALDQGSIIICSMKAGDFTDGGHFIVIYGYDSNGFLVNDSNCVARSREKWDYEKLKKQIKHMWVYSKE